MHIMRQLVIHDGATFFPAEFFKHDTDGDNAITFNEFQKQMSAIRPRRREVTTWSAPCSVHFDPDMIRTYFRLCSLCE